jgi:putative transposase
MTIPLRIEYSGAVYHVTSRGNARNDIYRDERDLANFLDILNEIAKRYNWLCHAYCLMSNHYHLVVETPEANISVGIRQLNVLYSQRLHNSSIANSAGQVLLGSKGFVRQFKGLLKDKENY